MKNVYNFKTVSSALISGTFLSVYIAIFGGAMAYIVTAMLNVGTTGSVIVGAIAAVPSLMAIVVAYKWAFAAETDPENF